MSRKRANNEGTLYFHKMRKCWCAQISLEGRRLTKYARTQAECRDWIREMQIKIGNGLTYHGMRVTLAQFVDSWLAGKEISQRPNTVVQYRQIATRYILPALGSMRVVDIRPNHIKQLYFRVKEEGAGARTVQMVHTELFGILKQALREGLIGRNPVEAVERPKVEQTEIQVLSEEQAQQFVIATQNHRLGAFFYLALMTGIREGELLGLKWPDVDWNKGMLKVQRQLQRVPDRGLVLVPPKTRAGIREVKLGPATMERLAEHRSEQARRKVAIGDQWEEADLIFPNKFGRPMEAETVYDIFKQFLWKHGLPNIRFHDLRHTSITHLLDLGTPINTVQQRAGHSKASVTTDIYGHVVAHSQDEAAEKLEERFTPVAVKLQSK